ncbi:MAG TPA: hypothetical protein VGD43_01915 [Micromonospora sp.]
MTNWPSWQDVKAKVRAAGQTWDTEERASRRARIREALLAATECRQEGSCSCAVPDASSAEAPSS